MADNFSHRGAKLLPLLLGLLAVGFIAIRGCQEGPFGRRQIVALNSSQEAALGAQAYQEVLSKAEPIRQGPLVDAVREVVTHLVQATSDREFLHKTDLNPKQFANFKWEVSVVRSREVNAFCLPGGKMVVYTSILPVCETDAGLATVMGHEISHALAHHGAERMAQQQMAQIGLVAASSSMNDVDPQQRQNLLMLLNAGAQFGILSYSRSHETEADKIGLYLMATAGYNPRAAITFWQRMQRTSKGGQPPEFLSTHPSHERRIRDLQEWQADVQPLYQRSHKRKNEPLPLSQLER